MANLIRNLRTIATQIIPKTPIHQQFHTETQNFRKIERSFRSKSSYQSVRSSSHYSLTRTVLLPDDAELQKAACDRNVLRILRDEIQYELDHSPSQQYIPKCGPFAVDERPGEQWIILKRKFGEKEDIKIEVTMFDDYVKPGSVPGREEPVLHITIVVYIYREGGDVMEFLCSALPVSVKIRKVFVHGSDQKQNPAHPYCPAFKDLDDKLQESLHEFLKARGISDDLAVQLHKYIAIKDRAEYTRWLERVKSFVELEQKDL